MPKYHKFKKLIKDLKKVRNNHELLIPFGYNASDKLVIEDINKIENFIMTGITGSGKSMLGHIIINSLTSLYDPSKVKFLLVDTKKSEFFYYKENTRYLCADIKNHVNDALGILEILTDIKEDIISQKRPRDPEYILVIIDSFSDLIINERVRFENVISKLTKDSKKSGIFVFMWDSRMDKKNIFTKSILDSFKTKIIMQTHHVQSSVDFCGVPDGNSLEGLGDMLLCKYKIENYIRLQVPYISDREILKINKFGNNYINSDISKTQTP